MQLTVHAMKYLLLNFDAKVSFDGADNRLLGGGVEHPLSDTALETGTGVHKHYKVRVQ